jgi:proliferating cell nuclear antigen
MSDRIFEIKTLKSVIIKNLVEVVKQYIKETNLYISDEGIKISSMDSSKNTFTFIKLDADKFETFRCDKPVTIGVNIEHLHKCIKNCDRKDIITLYMTEDEENLCIEITNPLVGKAKIYNIRRLVLDNTEIQNADKMEFDYIINMPTTQFQKIVKDTSILGGKVIEIKSVSKQLLFTCDDGLVKFTTILNEVTEMDEDEGDSIKFEQSNNKIVQGKFKLTCLTDFIKASQLCENMNMYLANDKPLVLEYFIADIGILKLLVVPVQDL